MSYTLRFRLAILLVSTIPVVRGQNKCTPPPTGLVNWWPGDGSAADIVGHDNGTLEGQVAFAAGEVDYAFTFNGAGDVVFPSAGNVGTGDFSIDFWLKSVSGMPAQGVLGKRSGCAHNPFYDIRILGPGYYRGNPGHLLVELDQGDGVNYDAIVSSRVVNDGMFHLVAVVRQGTVLSLYLDGVLDSSATSNIVINPSNSAALTAGISSCNDGITNVPLTGQLDEIEFFDRAIELSDIQAIYNAGKAGKCKCDVSVAPCITNPKDGAHPGSYFTALSGNGSSGSEVDIWVDGSDAASVMADDDNTWEKVVHMGIGPHTVRATYANSNQSSSPIHVSNVGNYGSPLVPLSTFELLRTADIILALDPTSIQIRYYGSHYSHAALFLGGDDQGTPLIAEAVPPGEAGNFGQVRSVPIELSTVYTGGRVVDVWRPINALTHPERTAVAAYARRVTSQHLSYWSPATDLIEPFAFSYWFWSHNELNLLARELTHMYNEKSRTDRFICSTLVWQSYLQGTGGALDISFPNNAPIEGILSEWADRQFIDKTRLFWVFPDTIADNPQMYMVLP